MTQLGEWQRGFFFQPDGREDLRMYLWFYEWNLFEGVREGQHTPGVHHPQMQRDGNRGTLSHPDLGLQLTAQTTDTGADLQLAVTNVSTHRYPGIAAIIPCFNPGKQPEVAESPTFFDDDQNRTFYLGGEGLMPLIRRDIHFNHTFRTAIDAEAENGHYVFSDKWPTSPANASGGLLLRESSDHQWIAAIAWSDFLSLQGHNPWRCMHQSIRIGPLSPGATKSIDGRIYLYQGTREDCLAKFKADFPA